MWRSMSAAWAQSWLLQQMRIVAHRRHRWCMAFRSSGPLVSTVNQSRLARSLRWLSKTSLQALESSSRRQVRPLGKLIVKFLRWARWSASFGSAAGLRRRQKGRGMKSRRIGTRFRLTGRGSRLHASLKRTLPFLASSGMTYWALLQCLSHGEGCCMPICHFPVTLR